MPCALTRAQSSHLNNWHSACSPKNLMGCKQSSQPLTGVVPRPAKNSFIARPLVQLVRI